MVNVIEKVLFVTVLFLMVSCEPDKDNYALQDDPDPHLIHEVDLTCGSELNERVQKISYLLQENSSVGATIFDVLNEGCFSVDAGYPDMNRALFFINTYTSTQFPDEEYKPVIDTILSFNVILHEGYHEISTIYDTAESVLHFTKVQYFAIADDGSPIVVEEPMCHTTNIVAVLNERLKAGVPSDIRGDMRYKVYVENQTGSVYSYLNEFAAYYFGTQVAFDFSNYFLQLYNDDPQDLYLKMFVRDVNGSIDAYYEFKYFILKSIEIADRYYPDFYQSVVENENFWTVFHHIDLSYSQLIQEYKDFLNLHTELDNFTSYHKVSYVDHYIREIEKLSNYMR